MSLQEFFSSTSQKKCVTINFNGEFDNGKESEWTLHDFLNAASKRLGVASLNRIFNSDGVDIDDCMMIEDNDILFISNGDDFIPPTNIDSVEVISNSNGIDSIRGTIGGYRIGRLLGRGGFGEVMVGEHHLTGEQVALKFLRKSEIISMGAVERTTTEIQCLSALRHQHIIRLQQQLESPHHVVLVLELMEGGDLYTYLHDRQVNVAVEGSSYSSFHAALSEDEARHVFSQIISAVGYAHNQHICHRDLKLENLLLKTKTLQCVKIADFGLSAFYRPGAHIKSSCGTLSFLAPEVFAGTANAGPPLDVWAMGVILFALLCGRLPFEGPDLRGTKRPRDAVIQSRISKGQYKIEESLSPEAKDLVRRLLRVDPAVRSSVPEIFSHVWLRSSQGGVTFPESSKLGLSPASDTVSTSIARETPKDSGSLVKGHLRGQNLVSGGSSHDVSTLLVESTVFGLDSENEAVRKENSRSGSKSSFADSDLEHDLDNFSCLANLEHVSDDDADESDHDKISPPKPTFDYNSQSVSGGISVPVTNDKNIINDTIPVPPPSTARKGRFSLENSRENSYSSRNSHSGSKDVEDLDEDVIDVMSSSPRTPPQSVSSFLLVPLRRKEATTESKPSPRRPRTSAGSEYEHIERYTASNDCFDEIAGDEYSSVAMGKNFDTKNKPMVGGSSPMVHNRKKHGSHSWTESVADQEEKDNIGRTGFGDEVTRSGVNVESYSHLKNGNSNANGVFGSPTSSRNHNKLHMAGSLSLKSHTISSSPLASARSQYSEPCTESPRRLVEKRTGHVTNIHDEGGLSPSTSQRTRLRKALNNGSPDVQSRKVNTHSRASTSYGKKTSRHQLGTGNLI